MEGTKETLFVNKLPLGGDPKKIKAKGLPGGQTLLPTILNPVVLGYYLSLMLVLI